MHGMAFGFDIVILLTVDSCSFLSTSPVRITRARIVGCVYIRPYKLSLSSSFPIQNMLHPH
jgi:hypothetical protein